MQQMDSIVQLARYLKEGTRIFHCSGLDSGAEPPMGAGTPASRVTGE
jgi:hypothetical protein